MRALSDWFLAKTGSADVAKRGRNTSIKSEKPPGELELGQ